MASEQPSSSDQLTPGAGTLLPIIPIVLGVTFLVQLIDPWADLEASLVFSLAGAGAGLIGIPALAWSLEHGRTRLSYLLKLGAVAGLLPLGLMLFSGIVGRFIRGGVSHVMRFLNLGAPIPLAGVMPWRTFVASEVESVLVGMISAAIYWAVVVRPRMRAS